MTFFARTVPSGVTTWRGNACQDAHDFYLDKLQPHAAQFLASSTNFTNSIKGNLGEFCAFWVGATFDFSSLQPLRPANAFSPLSEISGTGIDLLWLHFGEQAEDDFAVVQEVKTTGGLSLAYADALVDDYKKLFGTDPAFLLQQRLVAAKNEVEFVVGRPDLIPRVTALAGTKPENSLQIRLTPTLLHDEGADATVKLHGVRSAVAALGWSSSQIEPWSISLDSLDDRLLRLAMGQS